MYIVPSLESVHTIYASLSALWQHVEYTDIFPIDENVLHLYNSVKNEYG